MQHTVMELIDVLLLLSDLFGNVLCVFFKLGQKICSTLFPCIFYFPAFGLINLSANEHISD